MIWVLRVGRLRQSPLPTTGYEGRRAGAQVLRET
jgi:hypothetical protein